VVFDTRAGVLFTAGIIISIAGYAAYTLVKVRERKQQQQQQQQHGATPPEWREQDGGSAVTRLVRQGFGGGGSDGLVSYQRAGTEER